METIQTMTIQRRRIYLHHDTAIGGGIGVQEKRGFFLFNTLHYGEMGTAEELWAAMWQSSF
jgi:hypothetical protein